ncbi:hypothetical protein DFJ73DRAFT_757830 [Zopfochytrium polystomum]|nr:hypothetical protein DFJ73DRAFT_757830 [Zopfochytrium polystomum]
MFRLAADRGFVKVVLLARGFVKRPSPPTVGPLRKAAAAEPSDDGVGAVAAMDDGSAGATWSVVAAAADRGREEPGLALKIGDAVRQRADDQGLYNDGLLVIAGAVDDAVAAGAEEASVDDVNEDACGGDDEGPRNAATQHLVHIPARRIQDQLSPAQGVVVEDVIDDAWTHDRVDEFVEAVRPHALLLAHLELYLSWRGGRSFLRLAGDNNGERQRPFRSRPLFPPPPSLRHADVTDVTTHHPSLALALAACPRLELVLLFGGGNLRGRRRRRRRRRPTPQPNPLLREETAEALLNGWVEAACEGTRAFVNPAVRRRPAVQAEEEEEEEEEVERERERERARYLIRGLGADGW